MIALRHAALADLDAMVALDRAAFGASAWSRQLFEGEFAQVGTSRKILVAVDLASDDAATTMVGHAVGRYVADTADVNRVAVLPARRRHGVGSQLLAALVGEAESRGCDRVLLEVAADNTGAIALYVAHGFETIDRRPRYYDGAVHAVVMQRRLGHE